MTSLPEHGVFQDVAQPAADSLLLPFDQSCGIRALALQFVNFNEVVEVLVNLVFAVGELLLKLLYLFWVMLRLFSAAGAVLLILGLA